MKVRVHLFAMARQRAGSAGVAIELREPATVAELRRALVEAHPELAPLVSSSMIAIDSEYAGDDAIVAPGSEVAIIPPVSGGGPQASAKRPPPPVAPRPVR